MAISNKIFHERNYYRRRNWGNSHFNSFGKKGYQVDVYEQNSYPGGKLSAFEHDGFRFDAGPSLFTLPELVDDLVALQNEGSNFEFPYKKLDESCRYFWEDGKNNGLY